jgi:hypothetical protein
MLDASTNCEPQEAAMLTLVSVVRRGTYLNHNETLVPVVRPGIPVNHNETLVPVVRPAITHNH